MAIPAGYDLYTWFNQIAGDLSNDNAEFAVFQKYWNNFTAAQKAALKTLILGRIDTAITNLTALKTDIGAV